jgi:hypothetical protein
LTLACFWSMVNKSLRKACFWSKVSKSVTLALFWSKYTKFLTKALFLISVLDRHRARRNTELDR